MTIKEKIKITLIKIIIKLRTRLYKRYRTRLKRLRNKD